ncbi:MAG: lytic transglycosylase domain-containing protein, partial [candidate division Zixibacteria bacterium]|nr:lytic transglycosylase domain-containing protein [candidate division Zixibacteria bacterium]
YEPLYDYGKLSRRGITLLHQDPYNQYNKAIPDSTWPAGPLSRGPDLNWRDTFPAVQLYGNDVEDLNDDSLLSGREYLCTVTGQNWDSCNSVPASQDFIAQTTLAASYGLTQVMWPTAYQPMGWPGEYEHRNPYLLFYPEVSLDIGAAYLRRNYERSDSTSWLGKWRYALLRYNGGDDPNYDDDVLNLANQYPPMD